MGKTQLAIILFFFSISGFSQTFISGGIYQNTTWSHSGNPYIATGNVVVFEDVTLTLEPGVIVKFNTGASLEIRGKLVAIGNSVDSIQFTSNLSSPGINSWKGIIVKGTNSQTGDGNQVIMEYCIGEYANYFIDLDIAYEGPYVFRHCYFGHNNQTNNGGGLPETVFEHCKFDSNVQALGYCDFVSSVDNSEFLNNEIGVSGFDRVDGCLFANNSKAALLANEIVQNCTIINNNVGVDSPFNSGAHTFINNVVKNNNIGIRMQKFFIGHIDFRSNTICENTTYNLELLDFNNADISLNCWCSIDSSFIRSTIYDGYVNTNYGLVNYMPLGDECPEMNVGIRSDFNKNDISITIFPNPFMDELNIELNIKQEAESILYDLNGKPLLIQAGVNRLSFNTSQLPAGVYIYEVRSKGRLLGLGRVIKTQ